jgi:hypothetical protein
MEILYLYLDWDLIKIVLIRLSCLASGVTLGLLTKIGLREYTFARLPGSKFPLRNLLYPV